MNKTANIILLLVSLFISSCAWLQEDFSEEGSAKNDETVAAEQNNNETETPTTEG